jgi:hypothetical protein
MGVGIDVVVAPLLSMAVEITLAEAVDVVKEVGGAAGQLML